MARITANMIDGEGYIEPQTTQTATTARLDAASAANAANAASTIKALQDLGVGGEPKVDTAAALRKLTGGQTLTDAEKRALGMSVTPATGNIASGDVKDPLKNKNVMPDAPTGYVYKWIGSTANGSWKLYKTSSGSSSNAPQGGGDSGNNNAPAATNITLVSTETDEYGNVIGIYSDGSTKTLIASGNKYKSTVDVDAYSLLEATFKDFGLEELVPEIKRFMEEGLGSNQAAVELRKTTAYITRFRGNEIRRSAGLNVISEAEYLNLENSYNETLRAYGQQGFFGTDKKAAQSKMADIIGNDISSTEFKDRVDAVVTRVNNSDPTIKQTLRSFYNIGDEDLISYFLSPKETLPKLQEKVTSAEIGSAALGQGLITDVTRATELAKLGVTKSQAQEGYAAISGVLPTATKLAQIYAEEGINYTQGTAEEEVFKQLESAKRKRTKLAEKEVGAFSGSAGTAKNSLGGGRTSTF